MKTSNYSVQLACARNWYAASLVYHPSELELLPFLVAHIRLMQLRGPA